MAARRAAGSVWLEESPASNAAARASGSPREHILSGNGNCYRSQLGRGLRRSQDHPKRTRPTGPADYGRLGQNWLTLVLPIKLGLVPCCRGLFRADRAKAINQCPRCYGEM